LEDGYILDIAYGYHSLQGANARPPHKPNQDSLLVSKSLGGTDLGLFAVFDGHGPKGEQASHFCRVHLADTITRHKSFKANPSAAYKAAFETIHERFTSPAVRRAGVDIDVSGSTAICALVDREEVRIANVGDSRAILGGVDADGRLVSKPLSTDHKPQRPDERDRIARSEAVIYSERYIIPEGDEHKLYVCREERGRIVYGVLFTRSIGDLDAHNHLGLTARPEVTRLNLDRTCDRFIVLATDGVWDQASEDDVGTLVNETEDPQDACDTIVDMARRRWDRRGNGRRDDITVMVMKLNWVPKDEWLATGEGRNRMDRRVVVEEDDEEDEVEFRRGGGAASSEHVHVDLED
jgi:serine/threonine protein phosphatase PrpC